MMLKYSTNNRNNEWLEDMLFDIWENHFDDIPRQNVVVIKFGKKSKRQLGCLRLIKEPSTKMIKSLVEDRAFNDLETISLIDITSLFKIETVPEVVVASTIAHELCHYAHGFNSPLPKLYKHPHKGGIIRKELTKRDLADQYKEANKWLKANWREFVRQF